MRARNSSGSPKRLKPPSISPNVSRGRPRGSVSSPLARHACADGAYRRRMDGDPERGSASVEQAGLAALIALLLIAAIAAVAADGEIDGGRDLAGDDRHAGSPARRGSPTPATTTRWFRPTAGRWPGSPAPSRRPRPPGPGPAGCRWSRSTSAAAAAKAARVAGRART